MVGTKKDVYKRQELKESSLNAFKIAVAQMPLMMLFMNLTTLVVVWLGGNQILGLSLIHI